jgi:uncharacterized membrane protein YhhN
MARSDYASGASCGPRDRHRSRRGARMLLVTAQDLTSRSALAPAAAYAALAATDTYLAGQTSPARRRLRLLTKPLLMPALMTAFERATREPRVEAATPATVTPPAPSARRLTRSGTLVAQGFSWGGDVALMSRAEPAFLAGVGAFFGGHVAYTTTFVANGRALTDPTDRGTALSTALSAGSLIPVVTWAAGRRNPRLRGPIAAYAAMITAMVTSSTRLSDDVPTQARRTVVAGTGLFLASDSLLAVRKFLMPHPQPRSDAVVMATYTAGQGLIALGLAQAARAPRPAAAAPPTRVEEVGG